MQLTTDRLILREFREDYWKAVHEYASDPEVVRCTWAPATEEEARDLVGRYMYHQQEQPRLHYELTIWLKCEGSFIGSCDLSLQSPHTTEGCIGYCLNRRFWGRGYATEGAKALLAFGFDTLRLHRIFATCYVGNLASIRVLEKIGMQREGRLREHMRVGNEWADEFLYAILDHEWQRLSGMPSVVSLTLLGFWRPWPEWCPARRSM